MGKIHIFEVLESEKNRTVEKIIEAKMTCKVIGNCKFTSEYEQRLHFYKQYLKQLKQDILWLKNLAI